MILCRASKDEEDGQRRELGRGDVQSVDGEDEHDEGVVSGKVARVVGDALRNEVRTAARVREGGVRTDTACEVSAGLERRWASKNSVGDRRALRRVSCRSKRRSARF